MMDMPVQGGITYGACYSSNRETYACWMEEEWISSYVMYIGILIEAWCSIGSFTIKIEGDYEANGCVCGRHDDSGNG